MQLPKYIAVFVVVLDDSKGFLIDDTIQVYPGTNKIVFRNHGGEEESSSVEPRIMRLLVLLSSKPGTTFSREELIEEIWANKQIGEEGLTKAVSDLRKALRDGSKIKTVPKRGYEFLGKISQIPEPEIQIRTSALHRIPAMASIGIALTIGIILFLGPFQPEEQEGTVYRHEYLTKDKGLHLSPSISSDGTLVAYSERSINDKRLKLVIKSLVTGAVIFETSEHSGDYLDPVFSPANDFLAFVNKKSGYTYLSLIPTSGGHIIDIYKTDRQANPKLNWSPDGESLVFSDKATNKEEHDIFIFNLSTREVVQITDNNFDEINPVFSPNGQFLAYIQRPPGSGKNYISVHNLKTSRNHVLKQFKNNLYDIDWAKDGENIVFTSTNGIESHIQKIHISSLQVSLVSNQNFYQLSVNQNEDRFVASTYSGDNNIWMKGLNNFETKSIPILNSNRYEFLAEISPDQTKIAYVSDLSGNSQIWEYDIATTKSRQLTTLTGNNRFDRISWSPDSKSLLTGLVSNDGSSIIHLSVKDAEVVHIVQDNFINRLPRFSTSGKSFFFLSNRSGHSEIWAYKLTEGKSKKVSDFKEDIAFAQIDETNHTIYFTQKNKEGIWKSSFDGKEMTKLLCQVAIRDFKSWQLFAEGIYFIDRSLDSPTISFLNFETNLAEVTLSLPPSNRSYNSTMSVARDRSFIVFNQIDHFQSDIVLLQPEVSSD